MSSKAKAPKATTITKAVILLRSKGKQPPPPHLAGATPQGVVSATASPGVPARSVTNRSSVADNDDADDDDEEDEENDNEDEDSSSVFFPDTTTAHVSRGAPLLSLPPTVSTRRRSPASGTAGTAATAATAVRGASIPLVLFTDDGFSVSPEALVRLSSIEGPISVVGVAGLYRTGKSYLLNRVLLNRTVATSAANAAGGAAAVTTPTSAPGFTVGPTTRACTKGIWMWSAPIVMTSPSGERVNVLVLDTEGIGAPTADATHDTRIFALGLLLSSYFIYNSVGSIDEQALNNLSLVTNLSKELQQHGAGTVAAPGRSPSRDENEGEDDEEEEEEGENEEEEDEDEDEGENEEEEEDGEEVVAAVEHRERRHAISTSAAAAAAAAALVSASRAPGFLWVVRDFALQLRSETGSPIGPPEYLEDALRNCTSGARTENKNRMRTSLREYFPDRDCFTLVRPCTDESQLQNLDSLPDAALRPEFVCQTEALRTKIFREAVSRPMRVNNCVLSGAMLGMLCTSYVHAINAGKIPAIKDAWAYVCDGQRATAEQKLILEFTERINATASATATTAPDGQDGHDGSRGSPAPRTPCTFFKTALREKESTVQTFADLCSSLYGDGDTQQQSYVSALDGVLCAVLSKTSARFHRQYVRYIEEEVATTLSYETVTGARGGTGGTGTPGGVPDLKSMREHLDTLYAAFSRSYVPEADDPVTAMAVSGAPGGTASATGAVADGDGGGGGAGGPGSGRGVELVSVLLSLLSSPSSRGRASSPPPPPTLSPPLVTSLCALVDAVYTQHANLLWYTRTGDVIWKLVYSHYGGMEQQFATLRVEHQRVVQAAGSATAAYQAEVECKTTQHREELERARAAHRDAVEELSDKLGAKTLYVSELQAKLDELGDSVIAMNSDRAARVASSEQEAAREKLRAETAEAEIAHLKEDIDELTEETGMIMEQTRKMSELTLERDRLRADLLEARRMLQQEQVTVKRIVSEHKRESKEIQEQLLHTLKTMKDHKKIEHAQLKSARDEAQHKCAVLEGTVRVVNEELCTLRAQQSQALASHESTVKVMRAQMEENELRLSSSVRDVSVKLQESERAVKEKEKSAEDLTEKFREERVRLEQEKVAQLEEWKRRAVKAEDELRDQCTRTANANERASRKRARVDDSDKVMQLVRVEVELSNLRQEKIDLKAQLSDMQGQNRDQQQTIWGLQRGMDNQLTRLNIEHEARVTQLETQIATLEHKNHTLVVAASTAASSVGGGGGGGGGGSFSGASSSRG